MKSESRLELERMIYHAIKATSMEEVFTAMVDSICEETIYDFFEAYCDEHDCFPPDTGFLYP